MPCFRKFSCKPEPSKTWVAVLGFRGLGFRVLVLGTEVNDRFSML